MVKKPTKNKESHLPYLSSAVWGIVYVIYCVTNLGHYELVGLCLNTKFCIL